jgi:hypothetical protein
MPWTNVRVLVADYNARTNWTRRPPGLDSANAHVVQVPAQTRKRCRSADVRKAEEANTCRKGATYRACVLERLSKS